MREEQFSRTKKSDPAQISQLPGKVLKGWYQESEGSEAFPGNLYYNQAKEQLLLIPYSR
jgi:23S rRNA maturation mini-RNase III